MSTIFLTHPACLAHDTGEGHPERIQRLRAVLSALDDEVFQNLDRREAPAATRNQITRVHPPAYVDRILNNIPSNGLAALDSDTIVSPASGEAALRAAGAVCAAVDAVLSGEARNAFCAVRPPGHHAEPAQAMGFCLFNNVAVGAMHARKSHGLSRVAVVDFDVHHGNGTQAMFWNDEGLFFASTHQWPLYPGTGRAEDRGAHGNIVNVPLPPYAGSAQFRNAFTDKILPALEAFAPELIMISAGFDAHIRDPLANLQVTDQDFSWVTQEICRVAATQCDGRVVSTLEGGYDLTALAAATAVHVRELMAS